jgi:NAD(P)-dependent dehydrogenase (short-subunit alcohol dehydrogenase family)
MGLAPGNALITGAGKRLGRAMALELGAMGWSVAVHYNGSADDAETTAGEVRALGAVAVTLQADLLSEEATQGLVARAAADLEGPLTLLINNASIFEHDTLETASRESWDRHMESNLRAPFVLTQAFAAQAPEAGVADGLPAASACVVNMIDQRVWKPTPEFMTYTIAKMGLWALTRTAAQALAPRIRVNAIGPGPTMQGARQSEDHFTRQRDATLLRRGASPADIVAGLRYILSADALTGQMLALDGGQHLAWMTPDIIGVE